MRILLSPIMVKDFNTDYTYYNTKETKYFLQEDENLKTGLKTLKNIEQDKTLKIYGYCSQFKASLTHQIIIFKKQSKQTRVESFGIINEYNQDLEFSFLNNSSFFSLSTSEGRVTKNSVKKVKITFNEKIPGNYWKRIFCIIKGHWVLYIDCYASVKDVLKRPIPIHVFLRNQQNKENTNLQNIQGRVLLI